MASVRVAAKSCQDCDLLEDCHPTVFGEGSVGSKIMLGGEPPGDQEDREGHTSWALRDAG